MAEIANPAHPFDAVLTPYKTRDGRQECGFWVREDMRAELIELLEGYDNDAKKVGRILKDKGLDVAIQQWTWQEAEMNKRMFGFESEHPDVSFRELVRGVVRHPIVRVE